MDTNMHELRNGSLSDRQTFVSISVNSCLDCYLVQRRCFEGYGVDFADPC
jgi:hypothetical protein